MRRVFTPLLAAPSCSVTGCSTRQSGVNTNDKYKPASGANTAKWRQYKQHTTKPNASASTPSAAAAPPRLPMFRLGEYS